MNNWQRKQKFLGSPQEVRAAALSALAKKHYAAAGLRQKLAPRLCPEQEQELQFCLDEMIEEFCQKGYINERKMVEEWIFFRQELSARGPFVVEQELLQKGVEPALVEEGLLLFYDEEKQMEVLSALIAKELWHKPPQDQADRRFWLRLAKRLAAKGFAMEKVMSAIKNVDSEQ